jgi:hypothetical protein
VAWVITATCVRVSGELRVLPHAPARSSDLNSHEAVIPRDVRDDVAVGDQDAFGLRRCHPLDRDAVIRSHDTGHRLPRFSAAT